MPTLSEIREQYPQYQDMDDAALAGALHKRFYSDMPVDDFNAKIGYSQPSMLEDVGRSGATGVRQGAESLVGMAGDVSDIGAMAGDWLANKIGMDPATVAENKRLGGISPAGMLMDMAPTTADVQSVTTPIVGEHYQPQTVPGEYARTVGQFVPAAAAGPGGIGRRALMATVPAVTSETAGQVTEGTAAEPYARVAGALLGGVGAAGRPGKQMISRAAKGAPTREALKQTTDDLYNQMRSAGIKYDSNAYATSVLGMVQDFKKAGFRKSVVGDAFNVIEDLAGQAQRGVSPDFDDINGMIIAVGQKARAAERAGDMASAKAFGMIRDRLDEIEASAPFISTRPMPQAEFNQLRTTARSTAKKNIKARALEDAVSVADVGVGGQEAGIRSGIRSLLRSKRGRKLFSGEERTALLAVANGRKPLQTLSRFGFDLTSIGGNAPFLPTVGAGVAYSVGGPAAAAALPAVGTAAKALSPALTKRAYEQAAAAIRSGDLTGGPALAELTQLQKDRIVRSMLASGAGAQSAGSNVPAR